MKEVGKDMKKSNRRMFLRRGVSATAAATAAGMIIPGRLFAEGENREEGNLTRGDIAILRFLSAAEQVETDLWQQYSELGGTQDAEESGVNGGNPLYTAALELLDGDMDQYVHDNTDDEFTHHRFLNNYLESKGAKGVDLTPLSAGLPSSKATGAKQIP